MKLIIDTAGATAFELTVMADALAKLATEAPTLIIGEVVEPGNVQIVNQLAPASTVIPPAPVNAPASESLSPVPAAPSDTPAPIVSTVPAAPSDQKLDSSGFPWDVRIHTANKAVISDGTWRKKPGVAPDLVEAVRAEHVPNAAAAVVPDAPVTPAPTGAVPDVPAAPIAPVAPTLTAQDVLARCTEIQMANAAKGAALFQAIVGAGVPGGPMALPAVTDAAVLAACLEAVNAVGAA